MVLLFCSNTARPASANLPSCFQVDETLQQWNYILPGACRTPIPWLISPPSQTAQWSQAYLTNQGYGPVSPNYNIALNNYINIMSDTASSYTPSNLSYTILGGDANLQHILFQNSNGTYLLALWQNTYNYSSSTPPWGNPPDGSTVPEFISVEVAGSGYQAYATRWVRGGRVVQYYIQPSSCGNNYCFAAAVSSSLLIYQIGPYGFTPIPTYNNGSITSPTPTPSPTSTPTATPTAGPTSSPTAGPLTVFPTTLSFANYLAQPQFLTISDPNFNGNFNVTVNPANIVNVSTIGSSVTVTPVTNASGSTNITISDGNSQIVVPVTVGSVPTSPPTSPPPTPTPTPTPPPTPGPLAGVPSSLTFALTSSPCQNITLSDPGFAGTFIPTVLPINIVNLTLTTATNLQVCPQGTNTGTATISVSDTYNTITINAGVVATPAPGVVSISPSGPFNFTSPTAASQTATASQINYSGSFTASVSPSNVATATVTGGNLITITPVSSNNAGGTATLTVTGGNAQTVTATITVAPVPGPLTVNPTSYTFANPQAGSITVIISDPNNTVPFTATSNNTSVATVAITGAGTGGGSNSGTASVTAVGAGSAVITFSDGVRTATTNITVNPVSVPSPTYTNYTPAPAGGYPVKVSFAIASHSTVTGVIYCTSTSSAAGGAVLGGINTFGMEGGFCNGSTNGGTSSDQHFYDQIGNQQASSTNNLISGNFYLIGGETTGAGVVDFVCQLPNTTNDCQSFTNTTDLSSWTASTISAWIGSGADGVSRVLKSPGYIYNIEIFGVPLNINQMNLYSSGLTAGNPYPQYKLVTSPTSLTFASSSSTFQTVTLTDTGYSGSFTASGYNSSTITVVITGTGPSASMKVTPVANGSTTITVSDGTNTATVPVTVGPVNGYQSPAPPYPGGLGLTSRIQYTPDQIAGTNKVTSVCGSSTCVYPDSASDISNYAGILTAHGFTGCSGCVPGYDAYSSEVAFSTLTSAGGPTNGTTIDYVTSSDPVYHLACVQFCGTAPAGITQYSIGSFSLPINITKGYRTQNSGNSSCDCHAVIMEYVGYTAGGLLPDISPYQYEINIENAKYGTSESIAQGCGSTSYGSPSSACTTFTDTSGNGWVVGYGASVYTTAGTGFAGCSGSANSTSNCNGYSPEVTFPGGSTGCGYHGCISFSVQSVNAQDMLYAYNTGYVDHMVGLGIVCLGDARASTISGNNIYTDYDCKKGAAHGNNNNFTFGTGAEWNYTDIITLNRTIAQINNDLSNGVLTTTEAIAARTMVVHGAYVMDAIQTYCNSGPCSQPVIYFRLDANDPGWATVQSTYGTTIMPNGPQGSGSVLVNFAVPMSYLAQYAEAVKPCVVLNNCTSSSP